jgi:hypothetical protein
MINDFKESFGSPEKVGIIIGDYDEKGRHMKGMAPTKGKGIRKIFKRAGYNKLYLVNEYNTSCKLYQTGEALVRCRETRTPLALKMLHEKKAEIRSISSNKNVKPKKI